MVVKVQDEIYLASEQAGLKLLMRWLCSRSRSVRVMQRSLCSLLSVDVADIIGWINVRQATILCWKAFSYADSSAHAS